MKKLWIVVGILTLLLAGCTKAPADTQPSDQPQATGENILPTSGVGEAVVPEEGDIVIEINP